VQALAQSAANSIITNMLDNLIDSEKMLRITYEKDHLSGGFQ